MRVSGIIVDLLVRTYARNGKEIYPQDKNDSLEYEAVANTFDIYTNDATKDNKVSPSPWELDDVSIRGIPVWRARVTVIGLTLNIVDASNATEPPSVFCSAGDSVSTAEAYALYDANRAFVKGAGSYAIYYDPKNPRKAMTEDDNPFGGKVFVLTFLLPLAIALNFWRFFS